MNKNLLCALVAMFLLTGGIYLQAAESSTLLSVVERAVADKTLLFADARVQQMCHEWPTCEEWVNNKAEQDPSFQVVDTEVERWVSKWEDEKVVWEYRFYVQTKENGQLKAYQFTRGVKGYSYNAPVLIQHFPGHPFSTQPTDHVPHTTLQRTVYDTWPGYHARISRDTRRAATGQRISKWDEQGRAVWEKKLYVKVGYGRKKQFFMFRAYQTKAGDAFTYEEPLEIPFYPAPSYSGF